MKIVDSHHHLWQYSQNDYPWIGNTAGVLKHDFLIAQLESIAQDNRVSGFVTVQARQTMEETRWLLELAEKCKLILGVVGWVSLQNTIQLAVQIEQFYDCQFLKGVRHVVQDETDDAFILGADFNQGVQTIGGTGWVYDILIYSKHLANTIQFVDHHPNQVFVLDHIAKPTISAKQFDQRWAIDLLELAKRPNVSCKFSGVSTEVRDATWEVATIRPYWDVMLEAFGSQRIMYGSDWPVCLLRTEYSQWKSSVEQLAGSLSNNEQQLFWSANASRIYGLNSRP